MRLFLLEDFSSDILAACEGASLVVGGGGRVSLVTIGDLLFTIASVVSLGGFAGSMGGWRRGGSSKTCWAAWTPWSRGTPRTWGTLASIFTGGLRSIVRVACLSFLFGFW